MTDSANLRTSTGITIVIRPVITRRKATRVKFDRNEVTDGHARLFWRDARNFRSDHSGLGR